MKNAALQTRQALARAAVLYALPLYEMARMQSASSPRRNASGQWAGPAGAPDSTMRWVNRFSHTRHLLGPADRRVVTPNNDTLYTNAWLDLSRGPLLIHTPDTGSRYYVLGFLDFYTNPFAYSGTRTTGTAAQTLFVHGPGWRGVVPAGTIEVASPTDHVWVLGRILAAPEEALEPVHALQDAFRIARAAQPDAAYDGEVIDAGIGPRNVIGDPVLFLRVVNRALALNPPPADQVALLAGFGSVGIGANLPVDGVPHGLAEALGEVLEELAAPQASALGGGWTLPVDVRSNFGTNWHQRALVARNYIGALGIEEAMYLMADVDSGGALLDGHRRYRLHFAHDAQPAVDGFWSLTMYRKSDCLLVDNPAGRYSVGDRTPGLKYDADGGLTIVIGHAPPAEPANWLPAPAEPFYLSLRLYLPRTTHIERSFSYPPIVPEPEKHP